jgi:hypothetical protein
MLYEGHAVPLRLDTIWKDGISSPTLMVCHEVFKVKRFTMRSEEWGFGLEGGTPKGVYFGCGNK